MTMPFRMGRSARVGAVLLLVGALAAPAFAQGSTGGTLGKTDQSLSGGGPAETPDKGKSVKRSAPGKESGEKAPSDGLPRTLNIIERSIGGEFRVQLRKTGGNTFEGVWSHGISTRMTVTAFTKNQVVMQRTDTAGFGLVTGHYTGKRVGNRVPGGTAQISNGFTVTWEATW